MNTKQLRQKILDLAIKGKLVPQDPNDEPASKLIERIREEKEQLIKEGKLKRDKNESHIFVGDDKLHYEKFADGSVVCIEDEIPFEIPKNWAWCRLKEVCKYVQRGKSPKYSEEKKIPVISQKCVRWTGLDFKPMKYITEDSLKNYETVRFLCDGDILWNSTGTGTVGRAALYIYKSNPFPIAVADSHVTVLRPLNVLSDYIHKYIMSPHVQVGFEDLCDGSTNQKELSLTTVCDFLIPIPPQSEQVRISSTVQKLLEIVETLENDKIDLSELIKQTKAKVLDLAIKGKLVPQNPKDEPADILLEKIREEKENLIKEGKLKRDKNETFIFKNSDDNSYYEQIGGETVCIDDDLPFEIPNTWRWTRINNISKSVLYGISNSAENSGNSKLLRITDIQNNNVDWNKVPYTTVTTREKETYKLISGDIVFARTGATVGKSYFIEECPNNAVYASYLIKITFYNQILSNYISQFFNSNFYWQQIINKSSGIGQPNVNGTSLKEIILPIPPYQEQRKIVEKIKSIFNQLDTMQEIFLK